MDYIDYIPAAVLGIVVLLIFVLTFYYRNRNLSFQVSKDTTTYRINGRYLVYITCLFLVLSAIASFLAQKLKVSQPKYSRMIQMIDSIISILFFGIIVAFIAGVQNLYALIALGGIILAIIGCGIWFSQVFIPGNKSSGAVPLGLAFIFLVIYMMIIYMSWNDNPSRYGTNWTITTVAIATIACLVILLSPILQIMNLQNPILDTYLIPVFNTASKVIFSGLLTYGVLSHA